MREGNGVTRVDYVAFSGGADSTALAIYLHEQGQDFELVFADTRAELPETYYMVTRVAKVLGKKLTVVSNGTFYQHLVGQGFLLPAPFCRWCTRLLKQVPQDFYFKQQGEATVAVGIRADEAHRMQSKPGIVRPLVDAGMDKRTVMDLCRRYDLLSPVYEWRSNVSCFCCFFQRKSDWRGLLKHHPELYALAEQWEARSMDWYNEHPESVIRFAWNQGFTLAQLRTASERQLALWPDPDEEPCAICSV